MFWTGPGTARVRRCRCIAVLVATGRVAVGARPLRARCHAVGMPSTSRRRTPAPLLITDQRRRQGHTVTSRVVVMSLLAAIWTRLRSEHCRRKIACTGERRTDPHGNISSTVVRCSDRHVCLSAAGVTRWWSHHQPPAPQRTRARQLRDDCGGWDPARICLTAWRAPVLPSATGGWKYETSASPARAGRLESANESAPSMQPTPKRARRASGERVLRDDSGCRSARRRRTRAICRKTPVAPRFTTQCW